MLDLCYNCLMDNQYKNKNKPVKLEKINNFEIPLDTLELPELEEKKEQSERNFSNFDKKQKDKVLTEKKEVDNIGQVGVKNNQNLSDELILTKAVEDILADGLTNLFQDLDQSQKILFKQKGEQTATTIAVMLKSVKYKIYEVLDLIRNWLFIIPGINKFFLEQEAKIKTDKILLLDTKNKNFKI